MKLPTWHFMKLGPIAHNALERFGYKLGASLHYEATGRILPVGGGVFVKIFSNLDGFTGEFPEEFQMLGAGKTLIAGNWHVSEQFRYYSDPDGKGEKSGNLAVFREGFALAMLASIEELPAASGWMPVGCL